MCPGQTELIQLYLDRELSPAESQHFVTHLEACPACQEELARLAALYTELASLDEMAPPPALVSQVLAHLPARSRRLPVGQLLLAGQILAGLTLVISTFPLLSSLLERYLSFSLWPGLLFLFRSLVDWGVDLGEGWPGWLLDQRLPLLETWGIHISPGHALMLVACLGLAWLAGNFLLLHAPAQSLKNRGAS